jgi:lipoprotein NlpD
MGLVIALILTGTSGCTKSVVRSQTSGTPASQVSKPKQGAWISVKRGDTLYGLARDNGITVSDLAAWNGIQPPYTIYPGQRIRLYPGSGSGTASAGAARSAGSSSSTSSASSSSVTGASTVKAPINSGFAWRWPTAGTVVGNYVADDATRQGIDIAGSDGQPVVATADGVVVYSGAGLVGYGELIIVKHDNNWLSAYGHNRRRLASEGQSVKAGQQIAEMGRTGTSREMLHFEIRYQGKPVDPLLYLPKR